MEVHIARCALCVACTGLSLRDRYLVCDAGAREGTPASVSNELRRDGDTCLAPEAKGLHCRGPIGWFGAELSLLESSCEGNAGTP